MSKSKQLSQVRRSRQAQPAKVEARLLFAQRHNTQQSHPSVPGSTVRRGQQHAHPFWQLDVLWKNCVLHLGRQTRHCVAPCLVWIPPNVQHVFAYDEGRDFLSMKLQVQTARPTALRILAMDHESELIVQSINTLFGAHCSPGRQKEQVISHLLSALFDLCMDDAVQEQLSDDPELQTVHQHIIDRAGVGLQVADLAAEIGQTPSYLSRRFKQAYGLGLKQFIQAQRAQRAADLLQYADLSISEIADVLGFPDAFCFSKFFKRHFKQSPRYYRQSFLDEA